MFLAPLLHIRIKILQFKDKFCRQLMNSDDAWYSVILFTWRVLIIAFFDFRDNDTVSIQTNLRSQNFKKSKQTIKNLSSQDTGRKFVRCLSYIYFGLAFQRANFALFTCHFLHFRYFLVIVCVFFKQSIPDVFLAGYWNSLTIPPYCRDLSELHDFVLFCNFAQGYFTIRRTINTSPK